MEKNKENILPNSWISITIDHIVVPKKNSLKRGPFGSTIKKDFFVPSGFKIYEQKNVIYNDFSLGSYFIGKEKFLELKDFEINSGDVLISCAGTIGRIAVVPDHIQQGIINQALLKITLDSNLVDTKYFLYLFRSNHIQKKILHDARGTAMRNFASMKELKQIPFPLPPLNEQKRIVAKIEELFSIIDSTMYLQKISLNLKSYVHSFLKGAFEGKLTELWREQNNLPSVLNTLENRRLKNSKNKKKQNIVDDTVLPSLPDTWAWTNFEEIASNNPHALKAGPFGSSLKKEYYVSAGYKIYGQEQVIRNDPDYGDYYIDAERFEMLRSCEVKPGDLLISLVGTLGKTLVLPPKIKKGIINPRLIKITLDDNLSYPKYIQIYFESQNAKNYFKLSSHGGTMDILNMGILKKLPISLPPLKEQHEIIKKYELELALIEDIKLQIKRIKEQTLMLKNSILKQAFEGKLVPQDPNDEPAEILLQKISPHHEVFRF